MAEKKKKSLIRLDRYLGEMSVGTRSQIREMAKKGRIQVNGQTIKASDLKIRPDEDVVLVDGQRVIYTETEYFMLNKPQGVVSATEDGRYPTVVSLISTAGRKDIFPVGRLDLDTEGLLLITNDGDLAHRLLSPSKHVDKVYFALVEGKLPEDARERLERGVVLEDGTLTRPAHFEYGAEDERHPEYPDAVPVRLTIHEGRFHQVKRMFEALGCKVVYLKRLSMGPLTLDTSLQPGEYRPLTDEELTALFRATGVGAKAEEMPRQEGFSGCGPAFCEGKKAVIFDLDGTLVDSMWMWGAIDIEYLGRYGHKCPASLQKDIEGMSFSETAVYFKERFNIPQTVDEIKKDWVEMSLEKYQKEVQLKPGAGEFLKWLAARGIPAGIATSNGREMVDAVLKALDIEQYFQVVATACEVAAGKPAPDIYLEVARRLDTAPEDCLVFEDVPAGILAGKNAGMTVCAVEDDFSSEMRLEKERLADFFINDYFEILPQEGGL